MKLKCTRCIEGSHEILKQKEPTVMVLQCYDCKEYATYVFNGKKIIPIEQKNLRGVEHE